MSMLPHSLCLAQAPLAGEKNKQPHITPQGLDTKHPQSNLPISLTKTFEQVTWISHTSPPPPPLPSCAVTVQLWTDFSNHGNQKRIRDLKKQPRNFISFPLSITLCHSHSITVHPLDLPPCIYFIFELALAVQCALFFPPGSKLSIFAHRLSISLSELGFCSPSSNNAPYPQRPLLLPAYQCNKAWISELHHYLTQMPVKGLSKGTTPVGLYLYLSTLSIFTTSTQRGWVSSHLVTRPLFFLTLQPGFYLCHSLWERF